MSKNQQFISVEPDSTIFVKAHGNLDIRGWEKDEVGITTDINVQRIRHEKKLLRLLFVEDCELMVPPGCKVIIERASGNARVRNLSEPIVINRVQGDLAVQDLGGVTIARVSDNCLLENIHDNVHISRVGGNLKGKNIQGTIFAERIQDDVRLSGVSGGAEIRSSGNIELSLLENTDKEIKLNASDKILLHLPVNPDVSLYIRSHDERIELNVGDRHDKINTSHCELTLGSGRQKITVEAGDKVRVTEEAFEDADIRKLFEELNNLWTRLKEESAARRENREQETNWEIKMVEGAARIAEETMDGMSEIASQITEDTVRQAEEHVRAALKRVEEQIRNLGYDYWSEPVNLKPKRKTSEVTAEERLIVMKMLQENKISVEEADRLLEILEASQYE
jgi:hypothetical protein